ncbi:hypothetical protein DKT68_25110 [Micromonospora acroterricola]|uniref:DUF3152 domain-containing protein n=1 Tax=Micromonospora acroterricola TaxID=2202421 RepID=A0A317CUG4_9ACTN|nr:DUF3152 domain-containing protein [Micromonospora acroterricola]PWR05802.1 hypothetical protein DKT68_25110 [Micromonospora acroterricola]
MTPSSPYGPPRPPGPSGRPAFRVPGARPSLVRMRRRRLRGLLLGLVLLAVAAIGVTSTRGGEPPAEAPAVTHGRMGHGGGVVHPAPTGYPSAGAGRFTAADGETPVHGTDGPLRRYRVAVERGTGQDAHAFAATVDEVLADPRSWIASGELRVQRVADADAADFTIYLATPVTSERMCAEGGLSTEGYTSCRLPGQVIINLARWLEAVPDYGAPLGTYRTYVINHEVGHEFGEEHEACPGPGEPAPVMQQQTYGLEGCVANAWPYVDGRRYAGDIVP